MHFKMGVSVHNLLQIIFVLIPSVQSINFSPSSAQDFQIALHAVKPGETVKLLAQDYEGDFTITKSGDEQNPITIMGARQGKNRTRIIGTRIAFNILASHWVIEGLAIEGGYMAVQIGGNGNTLKSLSICKSKRGIQLSGNKNVIRSVSLTTGNGITISNGKGNTVESVSAAVNENPALNILGDASRGILKSNSFGGPVNIQGNNFQILSNSFKADVNIAGCDNKIVSSSFKNLYLRENEECSNELSSSSVETRSKSSHSHDMSAVGTLPDTCNYGGSGSSSNQRSWIAVSFVVPSLIILEIFR